ncbi:response regulator transcription factor, partial [Patulibacter sp. S7RM1-6]
GPVAPGETLARTLSAGLAFRAADEPADGLVRLAERASREASRAGGGRIVVVGAEDGAGPDVAADVAVLADDPGLVALLRDALGGRGHGVRHLADPDEARALLEGAHPEAIGRVLLLDWDRAGVDVLALLRGLRDRGALEHCRVVLLTARTSEPEILQALDAGAFDHVAKPFSVPVLLQRVRRALGA